MKKEKIHSTMFKYCVLNGVSVGSTVLYWGSSRHDCEQAIESNELHKRVVGPDNKLVIVSDTGWRYYV
jgi:hypothetical protein